MAVVRISTSDTEWLRSHAPESEVIPFGTDIKGVMYFQAEAEVGAVEHVRFAGASMIRFDLGPGAPCDSSRWAMYPDKYLVSE